jgi:uncharacterized protein
VFWKTAIRGVAVFCSLLLLIAGSSGCTTYSAKLVSLKPELATGQYEKALATVEANSGDKDQLLYHLERGLIYHYANNFVDSNVEFAAADRLAADLYTQSISEGAFSLFSNDGAISYRARPFEMALVPYYKALNYFSLGQSDAAMVEARRASLLMSDYVDVTLKALPDEDKSDLALTSNNGFLLYMAGMLYDFDGEWNDAFISYRNAATAYQSNHVLMAVEVPPTLAADLERVSGRLGFQNELADIRESCPDVFSKSQLREAANRAEGRLSPGEWGSGNGEIALFLEVGFVPQKGEVRFDFPIFEGEAYNDPDYWSWQIWAGMGDMQAMVSGKEIEYWASVAAPELQDGKLSNVVKIRVSAGVAGSHTYAAKVENLARAARVTFDAEKGSIFTKAILRGLTKYLATRGVEKSAGELAGLFANIFGAATESADTRSWMTLPESLYLARLNLPPGLYDLKVEYLGHRGQVIASDVIPQVEVINGDWTFHAHRLF